MLVVGQGRARLHLDQDGGKAALWVEQKRLCLTAGKPHLLPRQILRAHVMRALVVNWLRVLGIRLDVHDVLPGGAFLALIDDTPKRDQLLNLILACSTIFPNFVRSESTKALNSATFIGFGTMPCGSNLSAIAGSLSAVFTMPLSRSTISGGVPAVPNIANQLSNSYPARPGAPSLSGATSGNCGIRSRDVTATARRLPAEISGSAAARLEKLIVTAPVATSVTAGAEPRYGTCK